MMMNGADESHGIILNLNQTCQTLISKNKNYAAANSPEISYKVDAMSFITKHIHAIYRDFFSTEKKKKIVRKFLIFSIILFKTFSG